MTVIQGDLKLDSKRRRAWRKLVGGGRMPRTERAKRSFLEACTQCLSPMNGAMTTATLSAKDVEKNARERVLKALDKISLFLIDGELVPILIEEERSREDLLRFMREEGITRQFEGPANRELHFYLIGAVAFLDFAAAYLFLLQFAEGAAIALGGALITSAATVGLSGAAVAAARQWLRPSRRYKFLAITLAPLASLLAMFVHVVMAHGRDDLITGEVSRTAILSRVFASPLDLSGEGLGFLFMGVLAFGLCCWEWVKADDPYPGLGAKWRRVFCAEATRDAKLEEVRAEFYRAIEGTNSECCESVNRTEVMAKQTLQDVEHIFIRLGVTDPGSLDRDAETHPGRIHLIDGWHNSKALIAACDSVGDLEYRLARRENEMNQEKPPPLHVEHLSECVRVEEARLWLDRFLAEFSVDENGNDGEGEEQ